MAATALIKFAQGANVGGDGEAFLGELITDVTLVNVNNVDVASWQIDLVYADPGSSLVVGVAYASSDNGNTPTVTFSPDARGSYRWVLKVWNVIGRVGDPTDVDIRVFSVPEVNELIVCPSQVYPTPLPDPRTGDARAKPNELNFSGQLSGWAGDSYSDGLMNKLVRENDFNREKSIEVYTSVSGVQQILEQDTRQWPNEGRVRAQFEIIVAKEDGSNFGYFNRTSLFYKNNTGVVSHLATGELIYGSVPVVDGAVPMNSAHALTALVNAGRYIILNGNPAGSAPADFVLSWKIAYQFHIYSW